MSSANRRSIIHSLNCFAAAMLGLYVAFSLGLPRPYWAMMSAYITSQPLSGATRSKAVYRIFGTLIGATAAVVLVPNLVDSPLLLSLALSIWVAGCLFVSLLDRTPRSYMMMLAGYTAALIGFPSVLHPDAIFDVAVSRVEEIGLGIICATLVHSLLFPRPAGAVVQMRVSLWLQNADRWMLDLLGGEGAQDRAHDQRQLAAAASEVRILATHLPFDTSRLRETSAAVQAVHERMLLLIPLLSAIGDRLHALIDGDGLTERVQATLAEAASWLGAGAPYQPALALAASLREKAAKPTAESWQDVLTESLFVRLADAVTMLGECHALSRRIQTPDEPMPRELDLAMARAEGRPLHRDHKLALRSAAATVLATMITCALWVGTGWQEGAGAAALCTIFCALFATLDDPTPQISGFGLALFGGLIAATAYEFAILPAIDGFPLLALALFPAMVPVGIYLSNPKRAGLALGGLLGLCSSLALQETFSDDSAAFFNANLPQYVGVLVALFVVGAVRSMSAETSAQRTLKSTWKTIERLAARGTSENPVTVAAHLVDRLALLMPRLARRGERGDELADEALRDLRVAMNILSVQQAKPELGLQDRMRVDWLMHGVRDHYEQVARTGAGGAAEALLEPLDAALHGLAQDNKVPDRNAVLGLVALRRNLFPAAPPPSTAVLEQPA